MENKSLEISYWHQSQTCCGAALPNPHPTPPQKTQKRRRRRRKGTTLDVIKLTQERNALYIYIYIYIQHHLWNFRMEINKDFFMIFSIDKLHMYLIGLEPMTSPSIHLLWEKEMLIEL